MKDFLSKWFKYFIFAGVFSFFINLLYLTFPIYMLSIYDRVLQSYSMPTLMTLTVGALFALCTLGTLDFIRSRLLVQAGVDMDNSYNSLILSEMLIDRTRIKQAGHAQGLSDLNRLRNYFAGSAVFSFFDMPWVPIYLIIIYFLHPMLGLVATGGAVAIIILGLLQEFVTKNKLGRANLLHSGNQKFLAVVLRNAEAVYSMGMVQHTVNRWKKLNNKVIDLQTRASKHAGMFQSMTKTLRISMQVFIYGVGAYLTLKNESTAGVMIAASIIMGRALQPIESGMATWKSTVEVRGAYQRLRNLFKTEVKNEAMELPKPEGKLLVKEVSLAVEGRYLLRNISFMLEPGEQLGLIGASAAGKSTLCRVLIGIWPSMAGKVRLDGADVYQWDKEMLGKSIGYLPQDVELLPGTISDNIARMGEIDSEKIVKAAQEAGVHDMILQLPKGYDTIIDDGGMMLSGGQRQLIGLARVLYDSPRLVVLDEPNSNLDQMGEMNLLRILDLLRLKKTTCIIVSHSSSFFQKVDKLLVMKEGATMLYGPREEVVRSLNENITRN